MRIVCLFLFIFLQVLLATGVVAQNRALNRPAVASSLENGAYTADLAVDGNGTTGQVNTNGNCIFGTCTRWSSEYSVDPQWIYVDLGVQYPLTEVRLYWEVAHGRDFQIQVSNDASAWTTVQTITNNAEHINTVAIPGAPTGRYVRVLGTARNNPAFGYSIWEFEVYAGAAAPLPIKLVNFSATAEYKNVTVKWTASIDQTSEFQVERSTNGIDFLLVGTITANPVTSDFVPYSFRDAYPLGGRSYYRLKYTEAGSHPAYSKIVSVNLSENYVLVVFPIPVRGNMIYIDLSKPYNGTVEISLINTAGVVVLKQKREATNAKDFQMNRNAIPAGNYLLQVISSDNLLKLSKMIVCQ